MAASNSRTGNKRSSNRSGTKKTVRKTENRKSMSVQEESLDNKLLQEICLIVVFALCVFLFLCNFGIVGTFGQVLSNIQFGLFGLPAYVAPLLFFFALAFGMINQGSSAAKRKLISGTVLYVLFSMLCELASGRLRTMTEYNIVSLYKDIVEKRNGGGILAGSLAYLSYHYLSMVGTILMILVLALICIVLLTEKSVIGSAKKSGRILAEGARRLESARYEIEDIDMEDSEEDIDIGESPRERRARLREEKRERAVRRQREQEERARKRQDKQEERMREKRLLQEEKEDEKILRMNKKSRGVMLDTTLTARETVHEAAVGDRSRNDMHEIMVHDIEGDFTQAPKEHYIPRTEAEDDEVQEISYPGYDGLAGEENYIEGNYIGKNHKKENYKEENYIEDSVMDYAHNIMPEPITEFTPENRIANGMDETVLPDRAADDVFSGEGEMQPDRMAGTTSSARTERNVFTAEKNRNGGDNTVSLTGGNAAKAPGKEGMPPKKYVFPPITLLKKGKNNNKGDSNKELKATALHLQKTLETFGVKVTITEISQGPSVTRFELQPEQGVKVSKIVSLADDIKLNLAATDIRIEAPIPGKAAVGIEVPNKENATVAFRDLIESKEYQGFHSGLAFAVGKDIGGQVVVTDIAKMPHVLIAGATGSGKSVCINTIIMSILYKAHPDDVKLIMIDPKVVELSVYNGIPHLLLPVVTDPKKAASALHWGVAEMTERYNKFAEQGVRDLKGYNRKAEDMQKRGKADETLVKMPQIVIIVDELADLMMVAPGEVEESICRLAQLARAAGIHLVIATQRPSVDVITGLIKANMPSRIAFAVSSGVDSRTILDMVGAERLLGKGDMLFYPQGYSKPARVQGAFVSDEEVQDVVDFLKDQNIISSYSPDIEQQMKEVGAGSGGSASDGGSSYDEYFVEAGKFIIEKDKASIGMLQRVFKIGFNRAARIMDQLCEAGVVGEEEGTKPRKVLMSPEQFESFVEESL